MIGCNWKEELILQTETGVAVQPVCIRVGYDYEAIISHKDSSLNTRDTVSSALVPWNEKGTLLKKVEDADISFRFPCPYTCI